MEDTLRHSTYLFAVPSWVEGVARLVDFGDTLTEYNTTQDPDAVAVGMDWQAVGADIYSAMTGRKPRHV